MARARADDVPDGHRARRHLRGLGNGDRKRGRRLLRLHDHRLAQQPHDDQDADRAMTDTCRNNGAGVPAVPRRDRVLLRVPGARRRRPDDRHARQIRHRHQMGDSDLPDGADLPAGFPVRVDRDLPDRDPGVRAGAGQARLSPTTSATRPTSCRGSQPWLRSICRQPS